MDELAKRPVGRPPNPKNIVPDQMPEAPRRPRSRKPFGTQTQKMAYDKREGFHRHWFNDIPGRVARAQEGGYDHVKDNEGKNVIMVVGTAEGGGPLHAYLMEIPEEWFLEDMAAQQQEVNEKESAIKRGELERKQGDGRYVPAQGISIKS